MVSEATQRLTSVFVRKSDPGVLVRADRRVELFTWPMVVTSCESPLAKRKPRAASNSQPKLFSQKRPFQSPCGTARIATRWTLQQAVNAYRDKHDANNASKQLKAAVTLYLKSRENLRDSTQKSYKYTLAKVMKPLDEKTMAEVRTTKPANIC